MNGLQPFIVRSDDTDAASKDDVLSRIENKSYSSHRKALKEPLIFISAEKQNWQLQVLIPLTNGFIADDGRSR